MIGIIGLFLILSVLVAYDRLRYLIEDVARAKKIGVEYEQAYFHPYLGEIGEKCFARDLRRRKKKQRS